MEQLKVNIYYTINDQGDKILDIDSVIDEFNEKLNELIRTGEYITPDRENATLILND